MKTIFLDLQHSQPLSTSNNEPISLPTASVLTIGNFDGVHLGHQGMLAQLKKTATEHNVATMVMIFEPQPREYFATLKGEPQSAPARLTSLNEKLNLLKQFAVDVVVVATFSEAFRSLSAQAFADLLITKLQVKSLVLGDDFRFGNDRTGDSDFLRSYGLEVTNLQTITDTYSNQFNESDNGENADNRISSTRVRELLNVGDLSTVKRLLGRDYCIQGLVVGGDKIGRTLDFPTANIELNRIQPALHGVYGVDVTILDNDDSIITDAFDNLASNGNSGIKGLRPHSLFGTANIGIRPSVDKPHDWRLEVFFPQFSGDLYGKKLSVRFLHHLHGERKYDGLDKLKAGIKQDVVDLIAWRKSVALTD